MAKGTEVMARVEGLTEAPGDRHVTYYSVAVTHVPLGRRWSVQRRYKEFDLLRSQLLPLFPQIPALPPKSLWNRTDPVFLAQRRTQLDAFIKATAQRTDLVRSQLVRDFLQIVKFAPEVQVPEPQLQGQLALETQAVRLAVSDRTVITLSTGKGAAFAQLYQRLEADWTYRSVWKTQVASNPTEICFDSLLTLLVIGLESGLIVVFRVYTELNCEKFDLFCELPAHISAVRGLALNYSNSYLYSTAEDCRLLVTDVNSETLLADISLTDQPKSMQFAQNYGRIYLALGRKLLIFSTETAEPVMTAMLNSASNLTVLSAVPALARVFVGTSSGNIEVYRLGMMDCEQTSHIDQVLGWKGSVTALAVGSGELCAGNDQGLVGIWGLSDLQLLVVLRADSQSIRALSWNPADTCLLVSCSGEKALKAYILPSNWTPQVQAPCLQTGAWSIAEEDLAGWDR